MNRIAETFWIAFALVLGAALAAVAVPIVAIVCFLALALPVAMRRVYRHPYCGRVVYPSTRRDPADRSRVAPTIETTHTVVGRSQPCECVRGCNDGRCRHGAGYVSDTAASNWRSGYRPQQRATVNVG